MTTDTQRALKAVCISENDLACALLAYGAAVQRAHQEPETPDDDWQDLGRYRYGGLDERDPVD
jgi:hypothetical protein